jgi:MFS-type transporter involved in bile tolerance (Atg22 family)
MYDWASQVYSTICVTFFMPLLLVGYGQMALIGRPMKT